ncbi:MAG: SpoIID/LytB domain-containing protein, partial [Aeromicrobium sp.]
SCTKTESTSALSRTFNDLGPTKGTDWYGKVRARDGEDLGEWSVLRAIDLDPTASLAQVGTPSATSTADSVTFSWSKVSGATSYEVCLQTGGTSTSCTKTVRTAALSLVFEDLGPTKGTDWYGKVRARDGSTVGDWSELRGVDLASAESASTSLGRVGQPSATSTTDSVTFSWSAVSGAATYDVCLQTGGTSTSCTKTESTSALSKVFKDLGPTQGTDWYGKVRARNGATAGDWSELRAIDLQKPSTAESAVTVPSSRTVTFEGHGYGHGIGMSQYGAEGAARAGRTYSQILDLYYPGTDLSTKTGDIRVLISQDTTDGVLVNAQSGLKVRDIAGARTVSLPTTVGGKAVVRWMIAATSSGSSSSKLFYRTTGGYVSYQHEGKTLSWSGDSYFYGPDSISLVLPNGSVTKLREQVRSAKPSSGSGKRDTVNVLSLENYVRGVVAAEMPSSWSAEALKAQSVAARTYGVRSLGTSRYYDICSTTACQVYGGASRETASTDSAIKATAGKVLTYKGAPALAQFSSSSGGYTNTGSQPYLKAVNDPYDGWSGNKNHDWTLTVKASTIERAYPSIGTLKSMQVTQRNGYGEMGGRVSALKLVGSKGTKTISGVNARWAFGLRSDWFGF